MTKPLNADLEPVETPRTGPAGGRFGAALLAWWRTSSARERRLLGATVALLLAALLWWVALQPALRTLRLAPAERTRLDTQLTEMRSLAQEAAQLRKAPKLAPEQATAALRSATERLGPKAKLITRDNRATVTFDGIDTAQFELWLEEVRAGARSRPVEASLSRNAAGFSGTVVLTLNSPP